MKVEGFYSVVFIQKRTTNWRAL